MGLFLFKKVSRTQATHALGFHWYTYPTQWFIHQTQQELIRHNFYQTQQETLMASQETEQQTQGSSDEKMWDVGGDAFDSMDDVGFLEFADLSLDEPEFENDLIIDN